MAETKKRIAIVGGGLSGIGSIASLKEEGHEPVCFEATDNFGGTWRYRQESAIGHASVMPTTVANNSKEMTAASNFPPPKECSNFMRHSDILKYATEYCKQKDIERYMRFNTEVIRVQRTEDYGRSGQFSVTVKDKKTGEVSSDVYDGVMVASGHFTHPKMETFPGQEKFNGTIMHTHSLKHVGKFAGKNVLVIGTGCSGLDAAEVTSSVANNVYLSTRSGSHVLSRLGPNGYPMDYTLLRRYYATCISILPTNLCSWFIETFFSDPRFDHRLFSVKPEYHILSKDPVLNDAIGSKLLSGSVVLKRKVKYFTENGVMFDGDDSITKVDVVIMATGYTYKFPFLEDGLLEIEDGRINLYKCMYPPQLPHSTLVFIGFVNPFGPGIPIGELQCRWAAQIVSGKGKLPSKEIMLDDITRRHEMNVKRYAPSEYMSVRVDFLQYMDEIASQMGAKPNLLKYLFSDFPLFLRLVFGPCLSYQYRLEGPHKWDGAREAIMTCHERMYWPLTEKEPPKKNCLQLVFEFMGNFVPRNIFY